jgi:AAA family ATP:ADP antiporter
MSTQTRPETAERGERADHMKVVNQSVTGFVLRLGQLALFLTFTSYGALRPLRDSCAAEIGSSWTVSLGWVTIATAFALPMLVGFQRQWWSYRKTVVAMFGACSLCVLVFACLFSLTRSDISHGSTPFTKILSGSFLIWFNVFNLTVTSYAWAVLVDLVGLREAQVYFPRFAASATLGVLTGAWAMSWSATVGEDKIAYLSGALLALAVVVIAALPSSPHDHQSPQTLDEPNGVARQYRSPLASLWAIGTNPYLRETAVVMAIVAIAPTAAALRQQDLMAQEFPQRDIRTSLFAHIDLIANALTLLVQLAPTRFLLARCSPSLACVIQPLMGLSFLSLVALRPDLNVLMPGLVLWRICDYGWAKPIRETLYTQLALDEKYQAKPLQDGFLARLTAQIGGELFRFVSKHPLPPTLIPVVLAATAGIWLTAATSLGKRFAVARRNAIASPA